MGVWAGVGVGGHGEELGCQDGTIHTQIISAL